MIHFTWFDVAVLVAFYFWPVVAGITAVLAAIGWLRPATRQHRPWRLAMRGTAALLLVDSLLAAPFALWFVGEWFKAYETTRYSYSLERIERIDGIIFPAGSQVQLSVDPPHRLESGTVPVPTEVLGLEIIGAFTTHQITEGRAYVKTGTLASATTIKTVPCAPGPFERDDEDDEVHCTLARDMPIAGTVLGARTSVDIWFSPLAGSTDINIKEGTLARSARLLDLSCGAGPVEYAPYRVRCVLDGDQSMKGIPLAGARPAAVRYNSGEPAPILEEGTLAAPIEVFGITMPAGTQVRLYAPYDAAKLRSGPTAENDTLDFILPEAAEFALHGATLKGSLELEYFRGVWSVSSSEGRGTLVFDGRAGRSGSLDADGWHFPSD